MFVQYLDKELSSQEYLCLAYQVAQQSPDPSTQNGAIILFSEGKHRHFAVGGCNTFPDGVCQLPERLERPLKYDFVEHAERSALFACWRYEYNPAGRTMYCCWYACADCARAIIQAGITRVVGHKRMFDETPPHWKKSVDAGLQMLDEAGVKRELIDGPLPQAPKIRFNGREWQP